MCCIVVIRGVRLRSRALRASWMYCGRPGALKMLCVAFSSDLGGP